MTTTFTPPNKKLTWLITGCSSGFGLSLARLALVNGHTVIASSRNSSTTPDLVKEFESRGGKWIQLDVSSPSSSQIISSLEANGTEIDVLVNNAGYCSFGILETASEEDIRAQMETMYFGPLRLIQAVLPNMRKRRFGVIVNFSSGAALDGNPTMGAYAGAKAGLDGLTKVLAKEVAQFNIRVLTVVLGTFNTNFGQSFDFSKVALPEDYKGSGAEQMIHVLSSGKLKPNGDKDKAMETVYDVVVGEGVGAGHEGERFLPLGKDMVARVGMVQEYLGHAAQVFGDVAKSVAIDG
ncbi:putative short-chain oxidoreductase [Stipitochalara longipes BDJ]|nr:putative short-chain oxidoreductase [Stipitochalara longipes BDJ]